MTKKIVALVLSICLIAKVNAQISTAVSKNGTPIAGSPFATFSAAITAVNALTIDGPVLVELTAGATEMLTSKIVLTATGTATNTINIQKSGTGANPKLISYTGTEVTPSTLADGFFALVGCDYVTINSLDLEEATSNTTAATIMEFGDGLFLTSATDGCQYNTI